MNRFHPKKLPGSKWTAVAPSNGEKHFVVLKFYDIEPEPPQQVVLEAIYNGNLYIIPWRQLKDDSRWRMGWK